MKGSSKENRIMVEYKTTPNKDIVRRYDKKKIEDLFKKKVKI